MLALAIPEFLRDRRGVCFNAYRSAGISPLRLPSEVTRTAAELQLMNAAGVAVSFDEIAAATERESAVAPKEARRDAASLFGRLALPAATATTAAATTPQTLLPLASAGASLQLALYSPLDDVLSPQSPGALPTLLMIGPPPEDETEEELVARQEAEMARLQAQHAAQRSAKALPPALLTAHAAVAAVDAAGSAPQGSLFMPGAFKGANRRNAVRNLAVATVAKSRHETEDQYKERQAKCANAKKKRRRMDTTAGCCNPQQMLVRNLGAPHQPHLSQHLC